MKRAIIGRLVRHALLGGMTVSLLAGASVAEPEIAIATTVEIMTSDFSSTTMTFATIEKNVPPKPGRKPAQPQNDAQERPNNEIKEGAKKVATTAAKKLVIKGAGNNPIGIFFKTLFASNPAY